MAFMKRTLGAIFVVLTLLLPVSGMAEERVLIVEENQPYLFGWRWDQRPESMARIPRAPASQGASAEDQPLRVQRELPRYRHYRGAAQIHGDLMHESRR
jgi:hypothetical protein